MTFHVEQFSESMFHVEHLPEQIKNNLEVYRSLLLKWQRAINLVSRGTLSDIWTRHIWDSLQLIPFLRGKKILDIGSGGGFPGMVLSIVGKDTDFLERFGFHESFEVTCVDSDQRKMLFLSEVARQTSTSTTIITDRVENVGGKFDTVTARGFAELKTLIGLAKKYSDYGVFLKGGKVEEEISEAQKRFQFKHEIFKSVTDDSGRVVVVYDIKHGEDL